MRNISTCLASICLAACATLAPRDLPSAAAIDAEARRKTAMPWWWEYNR